jgi:hypothetical protein
VGREDARSHPASEPEALARIFVGVAWRNKKQLPEPLLLRLLPPGLDRGLGQAATTLSGSASGVAQLGGPRSPSESASITQYDMFWH